MLPPANSPECPPKAFPSQPRSRTNWKTAFPHSATKSTTSRNLSRPNPLFSISCLMSKSTITPFATRSTTTFSTAPTIFPPRANSSLREPNAPALSEKARCRGIPLPALSSGATNPKWTTPFNPTASSFRPRSIRLPITSIVSISGIIPARERNRGEFTPPDTFVLHPYGRYCNANKFVGEVDTFEALENVRKHYPIDENRISVRGFSMGGAATWHIGAHHASLWAAISPGAGFVDTFIFQKVSRWPTQPPWYVEKLWHLYDVTDYAANLFNCPVVAYSGEIDAQREAAELMNRAMAREGIELVHIIGPNTAHKFEPKAKEEVARRVDALMEKGRDPLPKKVRFTTWTLRYNNMAWITVDGLEQHWTRARVDAEIVSPDLIQATTTNVSALTFSINPTGAPFRLVSQRA